MKLEPLKLEPLVEDEPTDVLSAAPKPTQHQSSDQQSTRHQPPRRRRRRRRIWVIALIFFLIAGLVSGGIFYMRSRSQSQVQFFQTSATTGNLSVKVSATGPIAPAAEYDLNFPVAGQVNAINVQVGQKVKKGQVLAELTIDKTSLQDSITQDQLAANAAQSNLNAAEQNLSNAKTGQKKAQTVNNAGLTVASDQEQKAIDACVQAASTPVPSTSSSGVGVIPSTTPTAGTGSTVVNTEATAVAAATVTTQSAATEAQCEQLAQDQYSQSQAQTDQSNASAQNSVTTAQQQVTSAQNSLKNAYAQLQAAVNVLNNASNNAILTAPADASVAAINGVVGQNVGAGSGNSSSSSSSSSQALIILTNMSKLTITAQVNEVDIGNVQVGQTAQFTVAAYPTQTFRATVTAINSIGQSSSNVVNYTVQMTVDQQSLNGTHLYPGMTATVNITTAERIGVLLIPAAALSFPSTAVQAGEISRATLTSLSSGGQGNSTGQGTQHIVLELKNGQLVPVAITTGLSDGQNTEVLSGLNDGDQVVTGQTGGNTTSNSGNGSQRLNGSGSRFSGGLSGGFGGGFGGGGGGSRGGP